ncbi:hypothetical protein MWR57_10305 [Desulfovibrionaceae bacterium CB1MN]|uniref:hypothetical protein n=1 Tax=Hydrosulfovibrio ferrireducens TaxID=2934181 RepID=UPI003ABAE2F7
MATIAQIIRCFWGTVVVRKMTIDGPHETRKTIKNMTPMPIIHETAAIANPQCFGVAY